MRKIDRIGCILEKVQTYSCWNSGIWSKLLTIEKPYITFRVVQSLFQQYDRSPSRVVVNKNQVSRSEDEAKKEVAATIEDKDEEDKEIMEVLGAEEVDTELDYEVNSEMTTIRECIQKMKCIFKGYFLLTT